MYRGPRESREVRCLSAQVCQATCIRRTLCIVVPFEKCNTWYCLVYGTAVLHSAVVLCRFESTRRSVATSGPLGVQQQHICICLPVCTYVHVYAPVAYGYETTLSANVVPFCVTSISPKITYIDEHCATRPWHTVAVAATPAAAVEWVRAVCARRGGKKRVVCVRAVCARLGGKVVVVVVEAPTY